MQGLSGISRSRPLPARRRRPRPCVYTCSAHGCGSAKQSFREVGGARRHEPPRMADAQPCCTTHLDAEVSRAWHAPLLGGHRACRALHRAEEGGAARSVARWGESVQHLGHSPEAGMDESARLFLCRRCCVQVRLCSRCDRGQRYCTPSCSSAARRIAQREAARRYQCSRAGRMAHAARSRRWRGRRRGIEPGAAALADANIVTHQGSPRRGADAPLPAWTSNCAESSPPSHCQQHAWLPAEPRAGVCRRCGTPLTDWVRQSFLRSGGGRGARHDHSP